MLCGFPQSLTGELFFPVFFENAYKSQEQNIQRTSGQWRSGT